MSRRQTERETFRFVARHAWCETCGELVGRPRVTVKAARADLREHKRAGHPEPAPGETRRARAGKYTIVPEPTGSGEGG